MTHLLLPRLILALVTCSICSANAQNDTTPIAPVKLDDGYGEAFLNYRPYIIPEKKQEPEKQKAQVTPPPREVKPPEGKEKVTVEWLRKNYKLLEERSIDNPTETNVSAYLYAKRIVMDKAQRFSEVVAKVNNEDPLLNENNRVPYASSGAQSIRNANYLAQQEAVRELSKQGGVVIFVDGSCRFCAVQLPVLTAIKNNYGMEFLVVSIDGAKPKGFYGQTVTDNGLYQKLGLKLTPSVVYVPKPKGYAGDIDPNRYLIVSQGFYAQDELVKQIAYAGHSTQLLTKDTMRDLDVWDRGVASKEDLSTLKLDPNKPETFKQTLQPLLLKQYK